LGGSGTNGGQRPAWGCGRRGRATTLVYAKRPGETETLLALCFLTAFGIATATHNNYKDSPGCPAIPSMCYKAGTVSATATDTDTDAEAKAKATATAATKA